MRIRSSHTGAVWESQNSIAGIPRQGCGFLCSPSYQCILPLWQQKGILSHQQTNHCCIDCISISRIPVGWWAGQNRGGHGRADGTTEPAWQRETHPSPEALLVPRAIAKIPGKNALKALCYTRRALCCGSQPCCQALVHIPVFPAPCFLPNPLIFMLVRMAISPSHGHWDQGSTSQHQLKQERFYSWCRSDSCLSSPCLQWQGQCIPHCQFNLHRQPFQRLQLHQ